MSQRVLCSVVRKTVTSFLKSSAVFRSSRAVSNKVISSHLPQPMKRETPRRLSLNSIFTPELEELEKIFRRYGHELRIAGGAVRDMLTDKVPSDLDFATTATPEQMKTMFEMENIRMINKRGEQHGTVTCRINDKENFEVTTLRIDVVTDGRHAEVKFTRDWQQDAARRDLTVNSMFLGLDGTLYDYFGGERDLTECRVCFVGDPRARIQEDYLRILRYFRFYGRIAKQPHEHDSATLKAIRDNAHGLADISGERIWLEVKKIAIGRHADSIFRVMAESGVTNYIGFSADLKTDELSRVYQSCFDLDVQPMTAISALLHTEDEIYALHKRVKMSNEEKDLSLFIVSHRDDDFGDEPFEHCQDLVCDFSGNPAKQKPHVCELLKYLNLRSTLEKVKDWTPPRFPVRGEEVLLAGVPRGPLVGKVLSHLKQKWKESRYTLDEEGLLKLVEEAKQNC